MFSENEFAGLGDSLSAGFFVDRVVTSLTRTQRLGRLQTKDRSDLQGAKKLLDRVLRGERWLSDKLLDGQSAESALAFDRAAHALPSITVSKEFVSHIQRLQEALIALLNEGTAPEDDIKEVRTFFFSYGRTVSAESRSVIERSSEPHGVDVWPQGRQETS